MTYEEAKKEFQWTFQEERRIEEEENPPHVRQFKSGWCAGYRDALREIFVGIDVDDER